MVRLIKESDENDILTYTLNKDLKKALVSIKKSVEDMSEVLRSINIASDQTTSVISSNCKDIYDYVTTHLGTINDMTGGELDA